jgi:hypothetical protein
MEGVNPNGVNSTYDDSGEIDVVEVVHQSPSRMEMHLHGLTDFGAAKNTASPLMGGDFHLYGLDWKPGFIASYLDGVKVAQYTGTASDSSPPHYMMLNFTIGGAASWLARPPSAHPRRQQCLWITPEPGSTNCRRYKALIARECWDAPAYGDASTEWETSPTPAHTRTIRPAPEHGDTGRNDHHPATSRRCTPCSEGGSG